VKLLIKAYVKTTVNDPVHVLYLTQISCHFSHMTLYTMCGHPQYLNSKGAYHHSQHSNVTWFTHTKKCCMTNLTSLCPNMIKGWTWKILSTLQSSMLLIPTQKNHRALPYDIKTCSLLPDVP
jgi:hypothetical protein